jgi:hypothetical protein
MSSGMVWYLAWTGLLAALLLLPVSRLIRILSARRLERRLDRKLSDEELAGQKRRAGFIALGLVIIFSALFNYNLFGIPGSR